MKTEADAKAGESATTRSAGETSPEDLLLAITTIGSPGEAESIARTLLEERLVACANLFPQCRSIYRWHGAVETAAETVILFKTTRGRYQAFERRLRAIHPYELPEIVALAPEAVLSVYAAWVSGETRRLPASRA